MSSSELMTHLHRHYGPSFFLGPGVFDGHKYFEPIQKECNNDEYECCFSSLKRNKHIKTRYSFVKDMLEQGGVETHYCQAVSPLPEDIISYEILTKPKLGR